MDCTVTFILSKEVRSRHFFIYHQEEYKAPCSVQQNPGDRIISQRLLVSRTPVLVDILLATPYTGCLANRKAQGVVRQI